MKPLLKISAKHKKNDKNVFMYFYSIKQARYINPDFTDFKSLGCVTPNSLYSNTQKYKEGNTEKMVEENKERNTEITFNKNKLVLLSKILKDIKNLTQDVDKIKKLNTQRRMIESLINGKLDKHIDNFQARLMLLQQSEK